MRINSLKIFIQHYHNNFTNITSEGYSPVRGLVSRVSTWTSCVKSRDAQLLQCYIITNLVDCHVSALRLSKLNLR